MSATNKCKGFTKSGPQCTRNCLSNSKYCWQHREIFDEKQLDIQEGSSNRISSVPLSQITSRTSTANTFENKVFEPNILKIIHQFNPIPEETGKVLTLPAKQKWELLEFNFHSFSPEMKFPIPNETYLNRMYQYLVIKRNNIGNLDSINWLLRHEVYYDEIYVAFTSKLKMTELIHFLIYIYEQKAVKYFYLLYPILKQKLLDSGYKFITSENLDFIANKVIIESDETALEIISNLIELDVGMGQEQYLNPVIRKSEYHKNHYFFNTKYSPVFTVQVQAISIFLRTRKLNPKQKLQFYEQYIRNKHFSCYNQDLNDLEYIYDNFKDKDLTNLFVGYSSGIVFTFGLGSIEQKIPDNLKPEFIYYLLDFVFAAKRNNQTDTSYVLAEPAKQRILREFKKTYPNLDFDKYHR